MGNRFIALVFLGILLSGCGSSVERLSPREAERLLFESIQKGAAGDVIKTVSSKLEIENSQNGTATAHGVIKLRTTETTYRCDSTIKLPGGKTISLLKQVRAAKEEVEVETSARFVLMGDGQWYLEGLPKFSITPSAIGRPQTDFPNGYDIITPEGEKLNPLIEEYNQLITARNETIRRCKKILPMVESYVEHDWYHALTDADVVIQAFPDEFAADTSLALKIRGPLWPVTWRDALRPLLKRKLKEINLLLAAQNKQVDEITNTLNQF